MSQPKRKIVSAFGWKFAERVSVQGANFILTLILARMLTADDYGLIALIVVFTSIATTFVQGGFNTALIQKKDPSGDDYVSILLFSLAVALLLYGILYLAAPAVAAFYRIDVLSRVLRVMALLLLPAAVSSVQVAYVTRDLRFRELGVCNFISVVASAGIGIGMARLGFGAWSLVAQQLSLHVVLSLALLAATRWIPRGRFSFASIHALIPFGSRILAQNLMVQIFLNIRSLIIGRVYTTADLGYFNRGKSFPQTIMESINGTIQTVLLPWYSKEQDNKERVVSMLRRTIRISGFLIFPFVIGLACIAHPLVRLLLTDKWLPCVPFLQIFAVGYLFNPIQTSSAQALKALGDSRTPLRIEIIRKVTEFALLILSMRYGVLAIALSTLVNGFVGTCVTFMPNSRLLGYGLGQQLSDLLPPVFLSLGMGALVLLIIRTVSGTALQLILSVLCGGVAYVLGAKLLRLKAMEEVLSTIKEMRR